jgi:TPR repeat protein
MLSAYYIEGVGVQKDAIESYKWALIAVEHGWTNAAEYTQRLLENGACTLDQKVEAEHRAGEFEKTNHFQATPFQARPMYTSDSAAKLINSLPPNGAVHQ